MIVGKKINLLLLEKKYLYYILCIPFTMLSYFFYLTEHMTLSRWGIIGVFFLALIGNICSLIQYKQISYTTAKQLFWVFFTFALLWDLAILSDKSVKTHVFLIVIGFITLNMGAFLWLFLSVLLRKNTDIPCFKQSVKDNIYPFFIMIIFFILSFETVFSGIKIDSYDYYGACITQAVQWDFSFETFRDWQLAAHNAFGYSLFAVIGEYLWPGDARGVRLIQIIMVIITIAAFSSIVRQLKIDHGDKKENAVITAMFAFTPVILGTIFEIGLDLPLACFFIWFLYSHLTGKKIFEIASVFLLLFSKEPGIILLFGFAAAWILNFIYVNRKDGIKKLLTNKNLWRHIIIYLIPALFYILVFALSDKWLAQDDSLGISLGGDQLYKFGINFTNIYVKTKEFLALNFAWLFILIAIICILLKFKKIKKLALDKFYLFVFISMLCFYLFNIFYITYCNPRYLTPYYAILPLFSALFIAQLERAYLRKCIYVLLSALLLIQNFVTIDPIMLSAFKNINVGRSTIITTRTFILVNDNNEFSTDEALWSNNEMTHAASYNREYSYLGSLLNKTLETVNYDDKTLIALAPTYGEYMTKLTLFGNRDKEAVYYYDTETKRQTLDSSKTVINIQVLKESASEINYDDYERVFLLYFPYREKYYNADSILNSLNAIDTFDVTYRGWLAHVYQLK